MSWFPVLERQDDDDGDNDRQCAGDRDEPLGAQDSFTSNHTPFCLDVATFNA